MGEVSQRGIGCLGGHGICPADRPPKKIGSVKALKSMLLSEINRERASSEDDCF
ncbi:MAG: hypothetical protein L7S54_04345 [Candidatus Thalassarchaeaceae archaeon]|nr:hypothetical protein [Candidatus Thalassarchaeaceae archaeon]